MNKKIKILIVDDFSTMRRIVKDLLEEIGLINISEAEDGLTALNMMKKEKFDLLLVDRSMPKMNGIELLKIVKKEARFKKIPFIIITSDSHRDMIIEAAQAGVDGYIVKPFTKVILEKKIVKIFGSF